MATDFRIVSLCGSAGALPAYIEILSAVPANSGMAFVVLSHRRVENPCWLVQILSGVTGMHVEEIGDGMLLEPNCVYIGPAGKDVTTDGESLWLDPASKVNGWPNTFDIFLKSVARYTFGRAATVVLSGLDKDGSAALEMLRESGGMNYAQANAPSGSMPKNAIGTGQVDYVASPTEIMAAICKLPRVIVAARSDDWLKEGEMLDEEISLSAVLVRTTQAHIEQAHALMRETETCLRLSLEALRKSQILIDGSDHLIAQWHDGEHTTVCH